MLVEDLRELGGSYHPTAGLTPETVYPLAAEVAGWSSTHSSLLWANLKDLCRERANVQDGHLRILLLRSCHALGLIEVRAY